MDSPSLDHGEEFKDEVSLCGMILKLRADQYKETAKLKPSDFEYHVEGPHGTNPDHFGGPTSYTLSWRHPENQKRGCPRCI
jgi:hypothetical protein